MEEVTTLEEVTNEAQNDKNGGGRKKKRIEDGEEGIEQGMVGKVPEVHGYYDQDLSNQVVQWEEISRRLQTVLSHEIPLEHPDRIQQGRWMSVHEIEYWYGLELDGVILHGLALGEGGGGRIRFDWMIRSGESLVRLR